MIGFIVVTAIFVLAIAFNVLSQSWIRRRRVAGESVRMVTISGRAVMVIAGLMFLIAAFALSQHR